MKSAITGEGLFDLDGMRPAIAEVIEILEGSRADIFDGGKKGCFASVDGLIKTAVRNAKADVTDAELVEMAVGPTEGRLKNLMKSIKPNAERHYDAPHHQGFNAIERDFQADERRNHYAAHNRGAATIFAQCQGSSSSIRFAG